MFSNIGYQASEQVQTINLNLVHNSPISDPPIEPRHVAASCMIGSSDAVVGEAGAEDFIQARVR